MSLEPLLLLGAGGHCRSCIEVIESEGKFRIEGILDVADKLGQIVMGYPVIGTDSDLPRLVGSIRNCLVTVGQVKSAKLREDLFTRVVELGGALPVIVASTARVSRHAVLGAGTIAMHFVLANAAARIGRNVILNTGSVVEHDAVIGDHSHVSTGCVVNGGCRVGDGVFLGSCSVLCHGVSIAPGAVVGAGAVVCSDITTSGVFAGNPARELGDR
jgi:sugar O-acyltransferase (sialic acid O-acetyltransferase NeuD family)